jgi:hypothetical protein
MTREEAIAMARILESSKNAGYGACIATLKHLIESRNPESQEAGRVVLSMVDTTRDELDRLKRHLQR